MKKLLEILTMLIPFIETYPLWIKGLVAFWVILSAVLMIALLFGKPKLPVEAPQQSAMIPTIGQAAAPGSVNQSMTNSPGGIQAGGDVVISADRRLIQSIRLHVSIETETSPTSVSDPRVSVGLGSVLGLFTHDKTRIRFASDFKIVVHQTTPNRRKINFVYEPETPNEVLGKPVDFLGTIDILALNYAEVFKIVHFGTQTGSTEFRCSVIVNGIPIAEIRAGVQPQGALDHGQCNLQVADVFRQIPMDYSAAVSR